MQIRHFTLEGDNIREKIKNYIITKYPDGIIDVNDVLVCHSNRWSTNKEIVMISCHFHFNFQGDNNKVLVHLCLGGTINYLFITKGLSKALDQEYSIFYNWAKKWNIDVSDVTNDSYQSKIKS